MRTILIKSVVASILLSLMHSSPCVAASPSSPDGHCGSPVNKSSFSGRYDFFTNFGNYMPRLHCLRNADGTPDLPWSVALITLNAIVMAGYARIFLFWRRCYYDEQPEDRNTKLMNLAWIFALCALCGYGLSAVIFFWPAYRLLAIAMLALALVTWRFAFDLEPFRKSFTSIRLERQLNASLRNEKCALENSNIELKAAHDRLERTTTKLRKTNRDLDEFVYAASHDLRAPLRAISSLAQFVAEDPDSALSEQTCSDLDELQGRVCRMDRMLSGLLEYSRLRRKKSLSEKFDAADLVRQSIEVLDIPEGFEIQLSVPHEELFCPQAPLEQVIRNLVDNAIKHHNRDDGVVKVTSEVKGDMWQLSVSDDGPGIDSKHHERIFGMFETLRRRDELDTTGMGLALVREIVESHGGRITIESETDQGATFMFTWPRSFKECQSEDQDSLTTDESVLEEEVCHA